MNSSPSSEFETVISEAVLAFVRNRTAAKATDQACKLQVPLKVSKDEDLAELVQWLRKLCSCDALRQQFVNGNLVLDLRLSVGHADAPTNARMNAPVGAPTATNLASRVDPRHEVAECEDKVITEATLRRMRLRGKAMRLRADAVVTPSARDYARGADIRLQKGNQL